MDDLKKYLEDVPWDSSLKLSDGKTIHSLEQLPVVLMFCDDDVFYSHVTSQKNDFANWIRDVVGYTELADKIATIKIKEDFLKALEQSINYIKNNTNNVTLDSSTVQGITSTSQPVSEHESVQATIQPVVEKTTEQPTIEQSSPIVQQSETQPNTQSAVQPVVPPEVQQSVQPIVQSVTPSTVTTNSTSTVEMPVVTPVVETPIIEAVATSPAQPAQVIEPVQSVAVAESTSVQTSVDAVTPPVIRPESAVTTPNVVPETAPATTQPAGESASDVIEEIFDFEEIFKVLISELDQEVLAWDAQTS